WSITTARRSAGRACASPSRAVSFDGRARTRTPSSGRKACPRGAARWRSPVPADPRLLPELVLPVLPGTAWLWTSYRTDRSQPEPTRLVLATFGLGVLAIAPAFGAERAAQALAPLAAVFDAPPGGGRPFDIALACFFVIGPAEELAKFSAV